MRKKIGYLSIAIICFVMFVPLVFAAGYSVSTTSTSVTVGSSSSLTIRGSDVAGKFSITTSNSSVVGISSSSVWVDNNSQSIKLTAKKAGSAKITITPTDVTSYSGSAVTGSKTVTITVVEKSASAPQTPAKPKSTNSYLASLTIDGYELDDKFDKQTLEYSATVKEGTEKIKVNAQLADSSAKVTGIGSLAVTEGLNTFNIVVTAENGSKRTYVLKVTVKEYEPINVKVDDVDYTVIRKKKDLPEISDYFESKEVVIGEDKVDGYYNETLNYTLVGLKDKLGNIGYYIYKDGQYTLYNEQVFNGVVLRVLDKEIDKGYKKTYFSYDDTKITSYQEVKMDIIKNTYALDNSEIVGNNFYLFYAINMETGKEELYQYDSVEKTVQRYNTLILDMYKEQSDRYYLYLLCSILVLGITIVTFSMIIICGNKRRKKLYKQLKISGKSTKKNSKKIERELELD